MRDCPNCGSPVDGSVCLVCNPPAKDDGKPTERRTTITIHGREISVKLCQHLDRGLHCNELARFSSSTLGGGPFYCHKHFPPFRGR